MSFSSRPVVMGILNITPDSFSDGGKIKNVDDALKQAELMQEAGAEYIDIGGESTRPGAKAVHLQQELDRVLPVIEAIRKNLAIKLSVDTSKAKVMKEAAALGVSMINDVNALQDKGAIDVVAKHGLEVCLMHMKGQPRTMQDDVFYKDLTAEVCCFLHSRVENCISHGVKKENICLDPGFGFGKSLEHNLVLMNKLSELLKLGFPLLIGVSRKSMIGAVLCNKVTERLSGGLALAAIAVDKGANIIRTHDVKETCDVVNMVWAVKSSV